MDQLINEFSKLNTENQQMLNFIRNDLAAMATAIIKYPNCVDISLIEFPPILYQNLSSNSIKLAIDYLEKRGQIELNQMIPATEYRKASGYLDYYIDCLKNSC